MLFFVNLQKDKLKQRIDIDTSVIGGYFDEEFSEVTQGLFKRIEKNEIKDYAKRIGKGSEHFKLLFPEEERGRIKGGRINVEATILLGRSSGSDEELYAK